MAITVTLPVPAVSGITHTLLSGGSLETGTTYYYVVIACDNALHTPNSGRVPHHSPLSEENSFTTTATGRSALIQWTNLTGATNYNILLSTTSGDYGGVSAYENPVYNQFGNDITDGSVGYTVSAVSTSIYVIHSAQLVNSFVGGISKDLGILNVSFSSTATHDLDDVYNAIVAAGYSDYVFYDGYYFILKGWLYTNSADAGTLAVTQKSLVFLRGGIINKSTTYVFRFGSWTSDLVQANYVNGCTIDIQNCRYPIYGTNAGMLQIYGCSLHFGHSGDYVGEPLSDTFYHASGSEYFAYNLAEVKDTLLGGIIRSNTSDLYDLKFGQGNNFGNVNHVRCKIIELANMPYSADGGKFYACQILDYPLNHYSGTIGYITSNHHCYFYNCEFVDYPNGMVEQGYKSWSNMSPEVGLYTDSHIFVAYGIDFTVLDEAGSPISGVTVNCVNATGGTVTWIEHEGGVDKIRTGNQYTTDRTTDSGGSVNTYYIVSYRVGMDPNNSSYPTSYEMIKTNYYPFTLTFSKEGYADYSILLETLTEEAKGIVTLKPPQVTKFFDGTIIYGGAQIY